MSERVVARAYACVVLLLFGWSNASAQAFEHLDSFRGCLPGGICSGPGADGGQPSNAMVMGPDGALYGTAGNGSPQTGFGIVYRLGLDGQRTILYNFNDDAGAKGCNPVGGLALDADGSFYGATRGCSAAGPVPGGTLFHLTSTSVTVLHHFQLPGPAVPSGGLAFGVDRNLYGITTLGGDYGMSGSGTVFKWDGALTTVASFLPQDQWRPEPHGDLTLARDGQIYGATAFGCPFFFNPLETCPQYGSVFRFPSNGTPAPPQANYVVVGAEVVGVFGNDDSHPRGGLLQASDGALYGATDGNLGGVAYRLGEPGGWIVGGAPNGNLIEAFGGRIYGTARHGGEYGLGRIFRLEADGSVTTVHSFDGTRGAHPEAGLAIGGDGHLYGTTQEGGDEDLGVVFRLRIATAIDITANGARDPITLEPGDPLRVAVAFHEGTTGIANTAEVYVAAVTPWGGVYWMAPDGAFRSPLTSLYSGPLPSFGPVTLLDLPDAGVLPAGDYYWLLIVDTDANGLPDGHYVDFVKTSRD